jgi:acyl carrier protein
MDTVFSTLQQIFDDVFDDDSIVVTPGLSAAEVAEWDSLNHIRLMLAVEKSFKIKFTAAQTGKLKNVGELVDLIRAKTPGS